MKFYLKQYSYISDRNVIIFRARGKSEHKQNFRRKIIQKFERFCMCFFIESSRYFWDPCDFPNDRRRIIEKIVFLPLSNAKYKKCGVYLSQWIAYTPSHTQGY